MLRDVFVDAAFKAAWLPLLHVPAKAAYNVNELRQRIEAAMVEGGSSVGTNADVR